MKRTKTKTAKILAALSQGKELSAGKIRSSYRVTNPSAIIQNLRNQGHDIQTTGRQGVKGRYYLAA
jgi:hypothetical protein